MASLYQIKHQIEITAALDTDEKRIAFKRAGSTTTLTTRADLQEGLAETRVVAKTVSDESLGFGGVTTCKFLYIETDMEISIKLNGGSESFKISPTTGQKAKLAWDCELTAITVSNASTTDDAIVTFVIAGV